MKVISSLLYSIVLVLVCIVVMVTRTDIHHCDCDEILMSYFVYIC
jgi:hypothetical protein